MSYSNGIITAPINIDDVKQALGTGSNDIAALCTSPLINKWAKFKPTRLSAIFTDNWAAGDNGDYGLQINKYTTLAELMSNYELNYTYNKPPSGYPKRLGDFRGYNHNAVATLHNIAITPASISLADSNKIVRVSISANVASSNDPGASISLTDFSFGNFYLGVAVYQGTNITTTFANCTLLGWLSATYNIATSQSVAIDMSSLANGRVYYFVPFLVNRSNMTLTTTLSSDEIKALLFVPLPYYQILTCTLTMDSGLSVDLHANRLRIIAPACEGQLSILNSGSGTIKLQSYKIEFYDNSTNMTLLNTVSLGDLYINSGDTYTYMFSVTSQSPKINYVKAYDAGGYAVAVATVTIGPSPY